MLYRSRIREDRGYLVLPTAQNLRWSGLPPPKNNTYGEEFNTSPGNPLCSGLLQLPFSRPRKRRSSLSTLWEYRYVGFTPTVTQHSIHFVLLLAQIRNDFTANSLYINTNFTRHFKSTYHFTQSTIGHVTCAIYIPKSWRARFMRKKISKHGGFETVNP